MAELRLPLIRITASEEIVTATNQFGEIFFSMALPVCAKQCKARTNVVKSRQQNQVRTKGEAMRIDGEQQITRHDLIIAVWEALDCESVGAKELEQIQRDVAERFGESAVESPAALARILADEGARLRHPEVLDTDAQWRERKILEAAVKIELKFSSLATAGESMYELESTRRKLEEIQDHKSLRELRGLVVKHKQDRLLVAGSSVLPEMEREEAKEIAGWLEVWLRTPELFAGWLDLRRAAPEFQQRFGPGSGKR